MGLKLRYLVVDVHGSQNNHEWFNLWSGLKPVQTLDKKFNYKVRILNHVKDGKLSQSPVFKAKPARNQLISPKLRPAQLPRWQKIMSPWTSGPVMTSPLRHVSGSLQLAWWLMTPGRVLLMLVTASCCLLRLFHPENWHWTHHGSAVHMARSAD